MTLSKSSPRMRQDHMVSNRRNISRDLFFEEVIAFAFGDGIFTSVNSLSISQQLQFSALHDLMLCLSLKK